MAFGLSLGYFLLVEGVHLYASKVNVYSNWWIEHSLAGYCVFRVFYRRMSGMSGMQQISGVASLFQGMPLSEIKIKSKKYCMILVCYGLLFEMWIGL